MLEAEQSEIVVKLIRKNARILRNEPLVPLRLVNSLILAQSINIPDQFLLPFSSSLRRVIEQSRFEPSALPPAVGSLFNKNQRCALANLNNLADFGERLRDEFKASPEEAVLVGEGAALSGLYQDPGAFPAMDWTALLRDGTCANGGRSTELAPPAEEWSEQVEFGNAHWRKPKPALLITLLAGHVGDPAASPNPPIWPHLSLALLVWRRQVSAAEVLELGKRLGQPVRVARGLTIAAHIFPELSDWLGDGPLGIPGWERKFAVPLAARRLVQGERE